jgi:AAA family ATP:ADP antiporter
MKEYAHRVVEFKDEEFQSLVLAFAYHFTLMCCYYIIQPLRDALGVGAGAEDLPLLFALSLVLMLVANPVFASLVQRFPPRVFIPWVYRFFLSNLVIFFVLLKMSPAKEIAQAFFLWVGIFNLFAISVFWGYVANVFDPAQGKRLFGFIGAGGTAGQLVGSGITFALAKPVGAVNLLVISIVLLEASVWCVKALDAHVTAEAAKVDAPRPIDEPKNQRSEPGVLDGVKAVGRSPYLLGICVYMFLYTFTSSFLYFGRANAVAASATDAAASAQFFGGSTLAVGGMTLAIQLFLTGRLMSGLGTALALSLVPMWTVLGFGVLAFAPILTVYALFDISRKTINYAVARPARELLYTVIPREEKYTAKSFIDTFIYRVGDASASAASAAVNGMILMPLPKGQKHPPEVLASAAKATAVVAIPFSIAWVLCAWWLGRQQQQKANLTQAPKEA